MKGLTVTLAKITISLVLLLILFRTLALRSIWEAIRSAQWPWLLVACSLIALGFLISAFRWQVLLAAQGIQLSLRTLTHSYLVGSFFNNFLPTTVGGDMVRAMDTSAACGSVTRSLAIILVERFTGVFALLVFGLVGVLWGSSSWGGLPLLGWVGGILLGLLLALAGVWQWVKTREETGHRFFKALREKIRLFHETIFFYKSKKVFFLKALLLAFLLQFNLIVFFYLIAQALGLTIPFGYLLLVIPLIQLGLMVPISINGIGLRENAYIFFLAKIGIPAAAAVALSWVAFALVLLYALVGGLLYASR